MTPRVTRVHYKSYSGPRIKGDIPYGYSSSETHWDRVLWLTAAVESGGKFGSITMYDGTAITAGLHQAIAVYPKELSNEDYRPKDDQGTLWSLLRSIELIPDFDATTRLWSKLADSGFYLGRDGVLRYLSEGKVRIKGRNRSYKAGSVVYGAHIRDTFTPNGGSVPRRGIDWETSKSWALAFYDVFSDPKSFKAQSEFGMEHFEHKARSMKLGDGTTVEDYLYGGSTLSPGYTGDSYDLAMAVFWSHSVNAPGAAIRILRRAYKVSPPSAGADKFSRVLLRMLGNSKFGRWNYSVKSGRWARTRLSAKKLWDKDLFSRNGIMPSSF